ncbi:MAG: DctP family TRAP transporter solute-binding subunit [Candidatus Marinimicrobia bacterium]|nr:DctP family TRAP transporter solute-binding subunit [Candidatus Neomarinimicrobiota bacterium]
MKFLIRLTLIVALPLLILNMTSCAEHDETRVLKLAHGLDPSHPVHEAMVYFGERIADKSNGNMRLDIYPSEQLGSERETIELLQIGSLDITKVSTSPLEGFVPVYQVFGVPYLFRNQEHRFNVLEGEIGKRLLTEPEPYRIRGLCFYDAGSRSFYTKNDPINHPDDLTGLKIRVQESPTALQMVRAMGGSPTPIAWGELYSALQQGIVDGAENNPPSFYLSNHYEVCKFYSLDEHTAVPDVLIISTETWNEMSDEERQIVQEAADESAQHQKKLWAEATQEALEAVQEAGVEVIYPEKAPFQESVQSMYETYQEQPEIYGLIQKIQAMGAPS